MQQRNSFLLNSQVVQSAFVLKMVNYFICDKSSILNLIEPSHETLATLSQADTYIVDLSVKVRAKASTYDCAQKTFADFVLFVLNSIADKAKRLSVKQIDVVVDFYNTIQFGQPEDHHLGQL